MHRNESNDPGSEFLDRVQRAAHHVLGSGPLGRELVALCQRHAAVRQDILADRSGALPVIAVVGATGQGKSWLVRSLIGEEALRERIASGMQQGGRTDRLVWIGPQPPVDLDRAHETYLACDADSIMPLGGACLLVDTPGASDRDPAIAALARRAIAMATALILVVRRDQLRTEVVSQVAGAGEGAILVPVINAVRHRSDPALAEDAQAMREALRHGAPQSEVTDPVIVLDYEIDQRDESTVAQRAARELAALLSAHVSTAADVQQRRLKKLGVADDRFRAQLRQHIAERLPDLAAAVEHLQEEADRLPGEVARSLIDDPGALAAAVRSRLRMQILSDTSLLWFPHRTIVSVLCLTHGAWDRVALALAGSLPSAVTATWAGVRNTRDTLSAVENARTAVRRRAETLVAERIAPLVNRFRRELEALGRLEGDDPQERPAGEESVRLQGIDRLQQESQAIFDRVIRRTGMSRRAVHAAGLVGVLIFWSLMAGPIVTLYREYLIACYEVLVQQSGGMATFPRLEPGLLLMSLILSLLPAALFAMVQLAWAQRGRRVAQASEAIRQDHELQIEAMTSQELLRLELTDPLLEDAKFLTIAGGRR